MNRRLGRVEAQPSPYQRGGEEQPADGGTGRDAEVWPGRQGCEHEIGQQEGDAGFGPAEDRVPAESPQEEAVGHLARFPGRLGVLYWFAFKNRGSTAEPRSMVTREAKRLPYNGGCS